MATISITVGSGSETANFFSYANLSTANTYMLGSVNHDTWKAFSDLEKERNLVEASRTLNRQKWAIGYETQALREVEPKIVNACIELAFLFATGETGSITSASTFDNTKRAKAGSVEVENFRPFSSVDSPKRFPTNIWELLNGLLIGGGVVTVGSALSSGTSNLSGAFDSWGFSI